MAGFPGMDQAQARQALAGAGVQVLRALDTQGAVDSSVLELVLDAGSRHVREVVDATPPAAPLRDQGMGAWHVNDVDEVHSVLDGTGIMEFWTELGAVAVVVEGGDVVVIQGAEHRYLPLTPQRWAVRFAGPADEELTGGTTGRAATPWPSTHAAFH
ncbi:MAG: hypothetical protein KGP12_00220 [Actinomycetales bacterium]|nr:hypothetical protein [Actinomycetales bacterium]